MTPKELKKLEEQADILFNNVSGWNTNALKRIGRRVKSMESLSYADLQAINNAAIVNQDVNAIMEELARITKQNVKDVYKIYGDMIAEQHLENQKLYDFRNKPFIPFKDNRELQAIVKAYARTTSESFVGLTMTKAKNIGFVDANNKFVPINKQFKNVLDKATMSIATGTGDFNSEMRDVLKELGGSGLRVDYGGGITRRLDTMVRQNLLWGAKQASVEYNNMISEELGCDGIEIDWHSNPRPSHEFMQGKQYILGKTKTINGIKFESADKALEALQDYGCLHFPTPIICGVSEPAYSPEELSRLNAENRKQIEINGVSKTGYEWKQTMRRLETEARKTKDQIDTLKSNGDNIGAEQLDYKLKAIKKKYNLVAKETGIKAQPEKMAVIKSAKTVDKQYKNVIIKKTYLNNDKQNKKSEKIILSQEETIEKAEEIAEKAEISTQKFNSFSELFGFVQNQIGNDKLPTVLNAEDFKQYSNGKKILYRGLAADENSSKSVIEMINEFKYGKLHTGNSGGAAYGRGVYFTPDENVVLDYANGNTQNIITAVLSNDAKIVDFREIAEEFSNSGILKRTDGVRQISGDVGSYAAIKGYDAISLNGYNGQQHYIILNRKKLVIKE